MYNQELDDALKAMGKSQISHALMRNKMTEVDALLQEGHGFSPKEEPYLLSWAANQGHVEGVELLIEQGYDPNFKDEVGRTALHEARDCQTALVLLEHGADINTQDANGNTPLHRDMGMTPDLASFLVEEGADVLIQNVAGVNPIDMANKWAEVFDEGKPVAELLASQETKIGILAALSEAHPPEIYQQDDEERLERMHLDKEHQEQEHRQSKKRRM